MSLIMNLVERDLIPDWILRSVIKLICVERLFEQGKANFNSDFEGKRRFIHDLQQDQIALVPEKANEQHYEVKADFYRYSLGKRFKYSSCFWDASTTSLDQAEEKMLSLYAERMEMFDGASVLELGCGWGSLSLWLAEHFPRSTITGVSNSSSQREFIMAEAAKRSLSNLTIVTCDMNEFEPGSTFDRIVSVEMFEHMRNWKVLFGRVSQWLNTNGKFFMHIFTHRTFAYPYDVKGSSDWMAKYFFSGGMMPSDDLPFHFQQNLLLEDHWQLSGTHYEKTARAWLNNMDMNRTTLIPLLEEVYGRSEGVRWFVRWRLFYMACEVLFGFRKGSEWGVSHYRFAKR